jgi:hypothetical protein
MKRDYDLIRAIMLHVQATPAGEDVPDIPIPDGSSDAEVSEHVEILIEADLLVGSAKRSTLGINYHVERLTWAGHDFIAAAANDTVWNKTKSKIAQQATGIPFAIFTEMLKLTMKSHLGL